MPGEPNEVNWRGVRPVSGIRGVWPARNSVRVNATGSLGAAGITIIYTVPVGKILFTSSVWLTSFRTIQRNDNAYLYVRNVADVEQYRMLQHGWAATGQQSSNLMFRPAVEASAGWDVCITISFDDGYVRAGIHGWLEDA